MQGTAADEKTVQEVQQGTPAIITPSTPGTSRKSGVHRSASNASAGAESVSREGKIRRNKSTSSRHSRHSNGAPSPGSPAMPTTPSSGLGRSNTVPSKRSPALQSGRFGHVRNETMGAPPSPLTPVIPPTASIPAPPTVEEVATPESKEQSDPMATAGGLAPAHATERSQERLLDPKLVPEVTTPSKERSLHGLFQRSPESGDKKQPNKLRKKRVPSSTNPSAASSTTSLAHSPGVSPNIEASNPMDRIGESSSKESEQTLQEPKTDAIETPSEPTPRASQMPSTGTLPPQASDHELKAQASQPMSVQSSSHEGSDFDRLEEPMTPTEQVEQPDKEKKRRWRLSRKKDDVPEGHVEALLASPRRIGFNRMAETSNSSVGTEANRTRRSFTNEPPDPALELHSSLESSVKDGRDNEPRGISGWIKNKMREAKETAEHRRAKSPPGDHSSLSSILPVRGKSMDIKRPAEGEKEPSVPRKQEDPAPSQ